MDPSVDRDALMALDGNSHVVEIEQDVHAELDPGIVAQDISIGDQEPNRFDNPA